MSLLQQHFEERREYIFNRLKQPEYMERSIEKVRQAQKEIKNTVRTIKDLLLLDKTTDPCFTRGRSIFSSTHYKFRVV
ncbi:hypothetical protein HFP65_28185 [Bacillus sp. CB62A.1]